MNEQLEHMLKYLRLGGLLANWDRYLSLAQKGNYSHTRLLTHVIEQEYQIKKENARKMRMSRAKIPEKFVIETFPFDRQPKLNKKRIVNMYDAFDYMEKCHNVIWIGPTGVGKTGLATAFLTHAVNRDTTVGSSHLQNLWNSFISRWPITRKPRLSNRFRPPSAC
jgi:DNA replication protein DnaC